MNIFFFTSPRLPRRFQNILTSFARPAHCAPEILRCIAKLLLSSLLFATEHAGGDERERSRRGVGKGKGRWKTGEGRGRKGGQNEEDVEELEEEEKTEKEEEEEEEGREGNR